MIKNFKLKKEVRCLKKYVRSSQYYNKTKKRPLDDFELSVHLSNYTIILVKKDKKEMEFIEVIASHLIE